MKQLLLLLLLITSACGISGKTHQDTRPTIKEYVNKEIRIADSFAGQSFTLVKEKQEFYVVRKIFGSGVPVISSTQYKVEFNSEYQISFSEIVASTTNTRLHEEFVMSVGVKGLSLYVNNLKVVIDTTRILGAEMESQ